MSDTTPDDVLRPGDAPEPDLADEGGPTQAGDEHREEAGD